MANTPEVTSFDNCTCFLQTSHATGLYGMYFGKHEPSIRAWASPELVCNALSENTRPGSSFHPQSVIQPGTQDVSRLDQSFQPVISGIHEMQLCFCFWFIYLLID